MFENVDLDKVDMLALALSDLEPAREDIQEIAYQVIGDINEGKSTEGMEVSLHPQTFASLYSGFCLALELLYMQDVISDEILLARVMKLRAQAEKEEAGKPN